MAEGNIRELNLYQKLAAITGELGAIKKSGRNQEQGYYFIEYAAVAGELRSLFAKYGVLIVPRMQQAAKQTRHQFKTVKGKIGTTVLIDFSYTVINADKPDDKFTVTWTGEATDYGDKATNKAATSALKYYLMRQFNISEQGDDPDAESLPRGEALPTPEPSVIGDQMTPATHQQTAAKLTVGQQQLLIAKYQRKSGIKDKVEAMDDFIAKYGKDVSEVAPGDEYNELLAQMSGEAA